MKTIDDINYYSEEELESLGVPRDTTIRGVSETAARPLIRNRDEQIRGKALSSISKALETGKERMINCLRDTRGDDWEMKTSNRYTNQ